MPVIKKIQNEKINNVLFLVRNDKESLISSGLVHRLINKLSMQGIQCNKSDMIASVQYITNWPQRNQIVQNKMNEISSYDLVITDRLHGMILSYINDTNCIVLNNNNGKVENLYNDYLKECNYINFCEPEINQILEMMNNVSISHEYIDFYKYFDNMANEIKKMI